MKKKIEGKRKYISIVRKLSAVMLLRNDANKTKGLASTIASSLGICPTTLSHWQRKYNNVPDIFPSTTIEKKKRLQFGKFYVLEHILAQWINIVRKKKVEISSNVLQLKAIEIFNKLPKNLKPAKFPVFKASNGWLQRFKARFGISMQRLHGESASVNNREILMSQEKYRNLLSEWKLEDIFNADETGLFFNAGPTSTLSNSNLNVKGKKKEKERFTVLACCSAVGEKKKLLVIGE